MFEPSPGPGVGEIGATFVDHLRRTGAVPTARAWDFLSLALGAIAADFSCPREQSSDGWTRQINLTVSVGEPDFWSGQKDLVSRMLCFLTGDIWQIRFVRGNTMPSQLNNVATRLPQDSVCLLSGGVDSLVGMLDLVTAGRVPLLVSQISAGDKAHQQTFAACAGATARHIQLNHNVRPSGPSELSQRARSLGFIAYGVLGATSLGSHAAGGAVDLYVPENGFISLNVPLTPLRLGSLSTRTTHPAYMQMLQSLLNAAGLRVRLVNPYQFKSKGEMLVECRDQDVLLRQVFNATSCGRFARTGWQHCGRCVPCLVRRSAFQRWGHGDQTTYKYTDLSVRDANHADFDDVRSVAMAIGRAHSVGVERWAGSSLNSMLLGDITEYVALLGRAMDELQTFLRAPTVT
jgi:7-cyano-7-deazaguanine synthase in queuosine biosynthesis